MSWQDKVPMLIRMLVCDDINNPTYGDSILIKNFIYASNFVFYDANIDIYDTNFSTNEITPDPSYDNKFVILCCLKAASLIINGEFKLKSSSYGGKVIMKDGPSEITMDKGSEMEYLKKLSLDLLNEYNKALDDYILGNPLGVSVGGPQTYGQVETGFILRDYREIF
jgi:hypothetical protein